MAEPYTAAETFTWACKKRARGTAGVVSYLLTEKLTRDIMRMANLKNEKINYGEKFVLIIHIIRFFYPY